MKNRQLPSERGQAMILIVLAIVGLVGITALAVDGGMYYADRRRAQNAADSAVLAASLARLRGQNYQSVALARAQQNGYEDDGVKSSIEVNAPPVSGPYEGNSEYIQIVITSHYNTTFGSVVGIHELTNNVEAVARAKPPEYGPLMQGYAVVSLAPASDCAAQRSFWAHGESTLVISGGGIFIGGQSSLAPATTPRPSPGARARARAATPRSPARGARAAARTAARGCAAPRCTPG